VPTATPVPPTQTPLPSATPTQTPLPTATPAPSLTSLSVVASTGTTTAGSVLGVTVTAKDQYGNTVTGYAGTIHFTSTDSQATLPANYTFVVADNGTHAFNNGGNRVTLKTAGSQTVTATDTVTSTVTGSTNAITVNPVTATTLVVAGYPASIAAGTSNTFSVTSRDTFGNTATGYAGTVHFTSTDGQSTLPANATLTNGTGTFSATLRTAGPQSITATDSVTGSINGTQTSITVTPLSASKVVFGQQPSTTKAGLFITPAVTVHVADTFGNLITTSTVSITIAIATNPPGNGSLSGTRTLNAINGVATFNDLSIDLKAIG
jgi:hypothetical protein